MSSLHVALLLFTFSIVPIPALAQTKPCSCTAPDGSCSVSLSCEGGCVYYCGNNEDCWAECTDAFSDPTTRTTIEIRNGTYEQLVRALRSVSGKDVQFTPTKPNSPLDVAFKDAPLWDAFEFLAARGTLRIDGEDFELLRKQRKVLLSGDRTSYIVHNKPLSLFIKEMAFLTGLRLEVEGERRDAIVNIELHKVTLREILKAVSKQTGTKIKEI